LRRFGRAVPRLTARAARTLEQYSWPGNIRELQHVIERAVLLSPSGILRLDGVLTVPDRVAHHATSTHTRDTLSAIIPEIEWRRRERQNLKAALDRTGGRVYGADGAASLLGLKPTTLISRLKTLGLRPPQRSRRS
jgi:transcriptional regulator with GAF, ATPase, and Fis domain